MRYFIYFVLPFNRQVFHKLHLQVCDVRIHPDVLGLLRPAVHMRKPVNKKCFLLLRFFHIPDEGSGILLWISYRIPDQSLLPRFAHQDKLEIPEEFLHPGLQC